MNNKIFNKVLNTKRFLNKNQISRINRKLNALYTKKDKIEERILKLGMLIDYDNYKKKGFGKRQLYNFYKQDMEILEESKKLLKVYQNERKNMFGYPANMLENDYMEKYLKNIDIKLPLLNNCGDAYNHKENECNYQMDSKKHEYQIVNLFCKNFGLDPDKYQGYITSGGTEGNFYGIRQGMEKFPRGIVYYSKDSHYSISKYINLLNGKKLFENIIIPSNDDGTINCEKLINIIEKNWESRKTPAIIVLTFGTTVYGSVDNIDYIVKELKNKKIKYYMHLDAAFYGGIPKNQKKSPFIKNINELDIDSISVSLHKYIGCSLVGGVVIRKRTNANNKYISYIGQEDPTLLGSRSIMPFSTLYHVNNVLNRSNPMEFKENVNYFEKKLTENNINYSKYSKGNIFILYNIKKEIAKKYQLAALKKKDAYHIIIMPFHGKGEMDNLITDLVKMYYDKK